MNVTPFFKCLTQVSNKINQKTQSLLNLKIGCYFFYYYNLKEKHQIPWTKYNLNLIFIMLPHLCQDAKSSLVSSATRDIFIKFHFTCTSTTLKNIRENKEIHAILHFNFNEQRCCSLQWKPLFLLLFVVAIL